MGEVVQGIAQEIQFYSVLGSLPLESEALYNSEPKTCSHPAKKDAQPSPGHLGSWLIISVIHIVTAFIPTISLLTKSP